MSTIGQRLKMARESLGFDQASFAKELGQSSRDTISRWERGLSFPPSDVVSLVHEKFGINAGWLITGEGEMRPSGAAAGRVDDQGLAAEVARASEAIDLYWLQQAIEVIETLMRDTGRTMSPEGKSKAIALAYDVLLAQGDSGKEVVRGFLKLVV